MIGKKNFGLTLFIILLFSSKAYSESSPSLVDSQLSKEIAEHENHFKQAILGLYGSTARKLTFDLGYYYVLEKERKTDMTSIFGLTISAAVSTNSVSASLGLGKTSIVSTVGAYGAQIDYTYMRRWEDDNEAVDYAGVELKCSLMVFVAKASIFSSQDNSEILSYLSIGVGF